MAEESTQQDSSTCTHNCETCGASCGERTAPPKPQPNPGSSFKHVIGVVSGKGGVGKTLVTCLLASELTKRGYKVGILDADATGPSIPRAFGRKGPLFADDSGVLPAQTHTGVKLISTNLMVDAEDSAIAWRGPMVTSVITQFFSDVNWGELDYLLIDMPPGTSDVLLTVLQMLPVEGLVSVSTPQDLVSMIVGKAVNLATTLDTEVLGLVENMSYFKCPDCNQKHAIFGESQAAQVAERYGIKSHATLPIDPTFARLVDEGRIEDYRLEDELDPVLAVLEAL